MARYSKPAHSVAVSFLLCVYIFSSYKFVFILIFPSTSGCKNPRPLSVYILAQYDPIPAYGKKQMRKRNKWWKVCRTENRKNKKLSGFSVLQWSFFQLIIHEEVRITDLYSEKDEVISISLSVPAMRTKFIESRWLEKYTLES